MKGCVDEEMEVHCYMGGFASPAMLICTQLDFVMENGALGDEVCSFFGDDRRRVFKGCWVKGL